MLTGSLVQFGFKLQFSFDPLLVFLMIMSTDSRVFVEVDVEAKFPVEIEMDMGDGNLFTA